MAKPVEVAAARLACRLRCARLVRYGPSLVVLAACGMSQPPRQTEFPTLDPGETYNTRISALRTTLSRGGITLRVAGADTTFATADCDSTAPRQAFGGCVRCELAGEATAVDGAVIEATTRAFRRYPAEVLAAANIDHVAMCTKIIHVKQDGPEHPAGIADVRGRGMLISVAYFLGGTYFEHAQFTMDDIAHHEMYHLLEYQHMTAEMIDDPEWRSSNPLGFVYSETTKTGERAEGFVDAYAMTNPVEDKASVFEYLMAHSDDFCEMAKTDSALRIKASLIWRRVVRAVGTDSFLRAAAPCVDWIER